MSDRENDGDRGGADGDRSGKGRGKHNGKARDEGGSGGAGLLNSIVKSAQSSVSPDALSSILSAGGKGGPSGMYGGRMTGQQLQDLQYASSSASATATSQRQMLPTSIRTTNLATNDAAYTKFSGNGVRETLSSAFSDKLQLDGQPITPQAMVGPFHSAADLDLPMHAYIRDAIHADTDMQQAWDDIAASKAQGLSGDIDEPAYHDAWARTIPAPMFPGRDTDPLQRGAAFDAWQQSAGHEQRALASSTSDFMAALDAEGVEERRPQATILSDVWRPPSPSRAPELTHEQYAMHRALAELQDETQGSRAEERTRPPDDDSNARTGVYAVTPEAALAAVWNATGEGERASEHVREVREIRSADGAEVVRRIRRLLQRGSYTDDVYGLPPALEATIQLAEQPETEANKDLRAKAIARLDALYRQLDIKGANI